jgi:hypothetical protein
LLTSRSFFDWVVLTCPTASVRLLRRRSWQELPPSNPFSDRFKAKFAERRFHELGRIRSELHTSRVRKRKVRIFEPSRAYHTPLSIALKNPLIPLPIPPQISIAAQSHLECPCS